MNADPKLVLVAGRQTNFTLNLINDLGTAENIADITSATLNISESTLTSPVLTVSLTVTTVGGITTAISGVLTSTQTSQLRAGQYVADLKLSNGTVVFGTELFVIKVVNPLAV